MSDSPQRLAVPRSLVPAPKRWVTALAVAVVASLALAATAVAAPTLSVELKRTPTTINRGDEFVSYTANIVNTASVVSGEKLVCEAKTWTNGATFAYQWLRDGLSLGAANGAQTTEYTVQVADQGRSLQCQVTATNAPATTSTGAISAPTVVAPIPVPAPPAPNEPTAANSRPTITTVETTKRLCTPPASWAGSPTWTFQWLRNGAPIVGATENKYTPETAGADKDKVLQCMATGTNASGAAASISLNNNIGSPPTAPANTVANTPALNGPNWTNGPTTFYVGLPGGLVLAKMTGMSGWACDVSSQTCTSSTSVAPQKAFGTITAGQIWIDESAASTVTVAASAAGGGAAKGATAKDSFTFGPKVPFELTSLIAKVEDESGAEYTQAGGHPFKAVANFVVSNRNGAAGKAVPTEVLRDGIAELPPGFIGNPSAAPERCTAAELLDRKCPDLSAVGEVDLLVGTGATAPEIQQSGVFRMVPTKGTPASFGFSVIGISFIVNANVRSDGDFGITTVTPLAPQVPTVFASKFTFCSYGVTIEKTFLGSVPKGCKKQSEATTLPFLSNPTRCSGKEDVTRFSASSWENPGRRLENGTPDLSDPNWKTLEAKTPPLTGCQAMNEAWTSTNKPSFSMQPDNTQADSPAGYSAHLHIPQPGLTEFGGLATSHLKDTTVVLPEGVAFNPSAADGLEGCSEGQIGLIAKAPIRFSLKQPECPNASKIGNVKVTTPLLDDPLTGSVYLASQGANAFNTRFAVYLAVENPQAGLIVKLPGKVLPDPVTGQITAQFLDNPQLPFDDLELDFYGGQRSPLANPPVCGSFATQASMTPWSAVDPDHPTAEETAVSKDPIAIDVGPGGSACSNNPAQQPFALGFAAGSADPLAGASKPFSFRVTRPDGAQTLDSLSLSPPPGFTASLKGIPYCGEGQIALARGNSGKAEQASPSCPAASRVGSTSVGAGAGSNPFYAPGTLYLAGPYKGTPVSVIAITPAVAGPFDLGTVVVRSALQINPVTARITAKTDPLPRILEGVPLRLRDVRITLDRPNWALNPTSCDPMSVDGEAVGAGGAKAQFSTRFQVGSCPALAFSPKLKLALKGGTKRNDHPALTATLTQPEGQANIGSVSVALPHSEFLDQANIRTVCTRVQFAAKACPKGAIYGRAEAISPLLDQPLTGPVYLRSSDNTLPDLVVALRGPDSQPIEIELAGRIDSVRGGIRNSFELVPDAAVSKFVLKMKGGKKGLLVNSRDICKRTERATVRIVGQNGKRADQFPKLTNGCGKKSKKKSAGKKRSARR